MASKLWIKVHGVSPTVTNVIGGDVRIATAASNVYSITSNDEITHLEITPNSRITKVEVLIGGTLLDLDSFLVGFTNLGEVTWAGDCNVTSMNNTFKGCNRLRTITGFKMDHVTSFLSTWEGCSTIVDLGQCSFDSLEHGTDAFKGCTSLTAPPPTGTHVRNGDDATRGSWPDAHYTFEIKVWTTSDPKPSISEGGDLESTDNGDGTWTVGSQSPITHIADFQNKGDITKIRVFKGYNLTSLSETFSGLSNLTSFEWVGECNVTDFTNAWKGCQTITKFPKLDFSKGTKFDGIFSGCTNLEEIEILDFTNLQSGAHAFTDCTSLIQPPATGTPVRNNDDATRGSWTLPNKLEIKVWAINDPRPHGVIGGAVKTTRDDKGNWIITSTDKITKIGSFYSLSQIERIEFITAPYLTTLESLFNSGSQLREFKWDGECNVTSLYHTFYNCPILETISEFDTSKVTNWNSTFTSCKKLVNLPDLDFSSATNLTNTFRNCTALETIVELDLRKLQFGENAFFSCSHLIAPLPAGTPVRDIDDATQGFWSSKTIEADTSRFTMTFKSGGGTNVSPPPGLPGQLGFTFNGGPDSKWVHDGEKWLPWVDVGNLNRPEIESDFTATNPTLDEMKTAFKLLSLYNENSWKESHDFYVYKDANKDKMILVKYRGLSENTESNPGKFFYEKLTLIN